MSRTLNFTASLLAKARNLLHLGQGAQATSLLERLARLPDLATDQAEEIHARLADIRLQNEEYRQGRRHLSVALLHAPNNARYHFQMAGALVDDPRGDDARAEQSYRKALRLAPKNAEYLADYGLFAMQTGDREAGLAALHKACKHAGADADLVGRMTDALLAIDEVAEARTLLRLAMFRNAGDRRFVKLWNDFQFQLLSAKQAPCEQTENNANAKPVILPFLRPCYPEQTGRGERRIVRHDSRQPAHKPHAGRLKLAGQRQA